MKNYTKTKTDRAWFSRLLEQETGNRAGLFLQPRSPHWATERKNEQQ